MSYWLVKFAPFRTSWEDVVRAGHFTLRGVRGHEARKHLAAMRLGDKVLFYRSQQEQAIMGIMAVSRAAYPDPTSADPRWLTCDFVPLCSLSAPVSLADIRLNPALSNCPLLRQPRLSVMPMTPEEMSAIAPNAVSS